MGLPGIDGGLRLAEGLRETLGPVRILSILRDPVRRFVSEFQYRYSSWAASGAPDLEAHLDRCLAGSFEDSPWDLQTYHRGEYHRFLPAWLGTFALGSAVVPLDPDYPPRRRASLLAGERAQRGPGDLGNPRSAP